MTDIVERLRAQPKEDHIRGCMGRQYSCDCGYDLKTEGLLEMAADEIERLRAALQSLTTDPPATLDEPDTDAEVIIKMRAMARRALEPKP